MLHALCNLLCYAWNCTGWTMSYVVNEAPASDSTPASELTTASDSGAASDSAPDPKSAPASD